MKYFKSLVALLLTLVLVSCNFTEKMTMNDDGSGRLSVNFDASDLMAAAKDMGGDEQNEDPEKMDSIIDFKTFIEQNRDSIMSLPANERDEILAMERFKMHVIMDEAEGVMKFDMFTDFKDVSEANNISDGFNNINNIMPNDQQQDQQNQPKQEENVKVRYSFDDNVFKRDAYILNPEKYQTQIDSMASMEMFLSSSKYRLEYTFPKKVKSTNRETTTLSTDGKTVYYEVSFMAYMKDPDLLDLEIVLED